MLRAAEECRVAVWDVLAVLWGVWIWADLEVSQVEALLSKLQDNRMELII
jgi:hypothetical protein